MALKATYTGLQDILEDYFNDRNCKIVLFNSSTGLTESSTIVDFLKLEPETADGYARQAVTINTWGQNTVLKAIVSATVSATFSAGVAPVQFDAVGLLTDGKSAANKLVSTIAGSPSNFTINNHGLAAGDAVFFTGASVYPTDLTAEQLYYVLASGLTGNTFRLATTPGGSAIAVGTSWTGDLICRYASGRVNFWELRPDDGSGNRTFTIQPEQTHTVQFSIGLKAG